LRASGMTMSLTSPSLSDPLRGAFQQFDGWRIHMVVATLVGSERCDGEVVPCWDS
jgi:hypothetical protein